MAIWLLLAAIGCAHLQHEETDGDAGAPSVNPSATLTATSAPEASPAQPVGNFAPLSIAQTATGFTVGGELPDQDTKTSLAQSLRLAFGSGIEVIDNTTVKPGVNAPDFAALGSILGAAVGIADFRFALNGDLVTLGGTASAEDAKTEVQSAVKAAWPKMKIVNNIAVK